MADKTDTEMAYAAIQPDTPGYCGVMIEDKADVVSRIVLARFIARWIKKGYSVDRVTLDVASKGFDKWLKHPQENPDTAAAGPVAEVTVPSKPSPLDAVGANQPRPDPPMAVPKKKPK